MPALAADATGPMPALVHCHASDPIIPWTRRVVRTRLPAQSLALLLRAERTASSEKAIHQRRLWAFSEGALDPASAGAARAKVERTSVRAGPGTCHRPRMGRSASAQPACDRRQLPPPETLDLIEASLAQRAQLRVQRKVPVLI